jgi:purple acid phosphatase-like protein
VRYDKNPDDNPPYLWDTFTLFATDPSMLTQHRVTLTQLETQTRYHFMVGSTDVSGNGPDPDETQNNNPFTMDSFFTDMAADTVAQKILAPPVVTAVDNQTAIIEWQTGEPSTSMVKFGENSTQQGILGGTTWANLPWIESDAAMLTIHRVTVTNLNPLTTYVFRVGSSDALGNGPDLNQDPTNASLMGTFTTTTGPDEIAPNITSVTVSFVTNRTALITWESDEPSTSMVQYGTSGSTWGDYQLAESDAVMQQTHGLTLTGIQPATTYFFRVGSIDAHGNGPEVNPVVSNPSDELSFTSALGPDETAPQMVVGPLIASKTDHTAVIQWTTDEPGNSQVQYQDSSGNWGTYALSENDAGLKTEHQVTLSGLSPDTLYYYRVSSTDATGNNHATSSTDKNPSIEKILTTEEADPPALIDTDNDEYPDNPPVLDYSGHTIAVSYDELNMQNGTDTQNYVFSPSLTWLDADNGIQDITSGGQVSTYRLYFSELPTYTIITLQVDDSVTDADGHTLELNTLVLNDRDADDLPDDWEVDYGLNPNNADAQDGEGREGDFDGDGVSNYTEFINLTDPKDFRSSPEGSQIEATIPYADAGIGSDTTRIAFDTAFAVLIVDTTYGVNLNSTDSVSFLIDDGVNPPFSIDLGHTTIMRSVKLNPDDPDTAATAFWAVYDRSQDADGSYAFDTTVNIEVTIVNTAGFYSGDNFAFRVESEAEHQNIIRPDFQPDAVDVDTDDPDLSDADYVYDTGLEVQSGDLRGAKVIYNASQPNAVFLASNNELPPFNVENVTPINDPLNLQPASVFNVPAKLIIPCPDISNVSRVNIYVTDGQEWQLALNSSGVQAGGYGWILPGTRVNHNNGDPSSIEFKVYHFSGVQGGIVNTPVPPDNDSDDDSPEDDVGSCFLDTVFDPNGLAVVIALTIIMVFMAGIGIIVRIKRLQ